MAFVVPVVAVVIYSLIMYLILRRHSAESPLYLLLCVAMGIGAAAIAFGLEYAWNYFLSPTINSHPSLVIFESFIGVSLVEESAKWIWFVLFIRHWVHFDRYTDGILYGCGLAAGFSLVEGLLYGIVHLDTAQSIVRSFTAVPVHFMFGIIMGFLFARYKLESDRFFWFSLLIPVLLHGLYDFFILQQFADMLMGAALVVFAGSLSLSVWVCRTAYRVDRRNMPNVS